MGITHSGHDGRQFKVNIIVGQLGYFCRQPAEFPVKFFLCAKIERVWVILYILLFEEGEIL